MMGNHVSQHQRYAKSQGTELDSTRSVFLHTAHIQFQSCKEHDEVDAHLAKQFKTAVSLQQMEAILSNQDSSQNKPDHMGNTQAAEQHG